MVQSRSPPLPLAPSQAVALLQGSNLPTTAITLDFRLKNAGLLTAARRPDAKEDRSICRSQIQHIPLSFPYPHTLSLSSLFYFSLLCPPSSVYFPRLLLSG